MGCTYNGDYSMCLILKENSTCLYTMYVSTNNGIQF